MLKKKHDQSLAAERHDGRLKSWIAIGSVLVSLGLTGHILATQGESRTVITPPEIQKGFWVSSDDASDEYFEEMTIFFTGLARNVHPRSIDYQRDVFLKYVAPSAHGALEAKMRADAERIKRENVAQTFYPESLARNGMSMAIRGVLETRVGMQLTSNVTKTYRLDYAMSAGRIMVTGFEETDNNDPFGLLNKH